jgi:hypothetical protein
MMTTPMMNMTKLLDEEQISDATNDYKDAEQLSGESIIGIPDNEVHVELVDDNKIIDLDWKQGESEIVADKVAAQLKQAALNNAFIMKPRNEGLTTEVAKQFGKVEPIRYTKAQIGHALAVQKRAIRAGKKLQKKQKAQAIKCKSYK